MSSRIFEKPGTGSSGESGVVDQAAFDGGEPDRAGADRVGHRRQAVPGLQAELSQLVTGRQVLGRVDERLVHLSGDEALEAAHDLLLRCAGRCRPG